jgi:hypothetical protein
MTETYYVQALDHQGNLVGLYVEASDYDTAYDLVAKRDDIDIVRSVQVVAGGSEE